MDDTRRRLAYAQKLATLPVCVPVEKPKSDDYEKWLKEVSPEMNWNWDHLQFIRGKLANVTAGTCRKLILSTPPQHGKSEGLTVRYPAFRLEHQPGLRVAVGGYSQRHANRFSRKTRKLVRGRLSLDGTKAQNEWETANGGSYLAVGVGAGITGMPVDLMIIDDPVKSREEADSEAYREKVWEWYMDDITTRLQEKAAVVIVMTRWHSDDLVGRILASDDAPNWECVNLPAIAEENDPLNRPVGAALCPERFTLETLLERQRIMGEGFNGLYQGRPVPRGGLFFKREWFRVVDNVPGNEFGPAEYVRYWDTAASLKDTACYTAGVLMAKCGDRFYVVDVVRGRWQPAERNDIIRDTAKADKKIAGFRKTYFEHGGGDSGIDSAQRLIAKMAGLEVESDRPTGSKVERAGPFADQARGGNVLLVAGDWTTKYLSELTTFPRGSFVDQVDSSSGAFLKLTEEQPTVLVGSY
jgi:predicted phage terminase large subunit-like protein